MQDESLGVQVRPPLVDRGLAGIRHARRVPAVPMDPALEVHVETDQDDRARPGLERDVERMEAAVAAPADFARLLEQKLIDAGLAPHAMDVGEFRLDVAVLGNF